MIYDRYIANLFPLSYEDNFIIALSGGSDSIFLMLVMQELSQRYGNHVQAVTFDHRLRANSSNEAYFVQNIAHSLNIKHAILKWDNPVCSQKSARKARYKAIQDFARLSGYRPIIVTGHHMDDIQETLLMRMTRGASWSSLTEISKSSYANGVHMKRPLLLAQKTEIIPNSIWVHDQSNDSDKYERNAIRQSHNIDYKKFINKNIIEKEILYREIVEKFKGVIFHIDGKCIIEKDLSFTGLYLIRMIIKTIGANPYPPSIEEIQYALQKETATLGRCVIIQKQHKIIILRDAIRQYKKYKFISGMRWDKRFIIYGPEIDGTYIRPLCGHDIYTRALPSLWIDDELITVPHFDDNFIIDFMPEIMMKTLS